MPDRVMSMYMVFVATTFNLMADVRVTVQITEGIWVTIREQFDTKTGGNDRTLDHRGGGQRKGKRSH